MMRDHAHSHRGYVNGLTGLRGFAAFWVLLYHTWASSEPRLMTLDFGIVKMDFTPLFSAGWAGVDFFFVLSAFLLTLPFARWACGERAFPSVGSYLVRRFKRVYPAFWAQLFILLIIAFTTSLYTFPSLPDLAAHLFMDFNLPPNWVSPINGVWWTLPTEFLFYLLLLPLALLLKTRATRAVLLSLVFVAWAYRWWVFETFHTQGAGKMVPLMGNTLGSLDEFIIGTYSAYLYIRHQNQSLPRLPATLFLWLGIAGVLLSVYSIHWLYGVYWEEGHPLLIFKNTVIGISVVSIIIAIVSGSVWALRLFANPVMMHIGIISYSLYLWHLPVIHLLSKWSFMVNYEGYRLPIMMAFVLPISWLLSYASYRWIERPFLQKRS
jgi:peptidoglycan/LPS O-acetylase OafA/YrhL